MAVIPKTRKDDARGNPGGGSRKGTPHEGKEGNLAYERRDDVAALVLQLSGYGMSQLEIAKAVKAAFGSGHSEETLKRHYREELDDGLALAKQNLLQRAHQMATQVNVPEGVSKDKAYEIASRKQDFLLNVVHRMRPGQEHDLGGAAINVTISKDDGEL